MNKLKTTVILLLSLGLIFGLSACTAEETPALAPVQTISLDNVVAEGIVLPIQESWINFATQGRVAEILVEEGEKVSQGQVLIQLENSQAAEASLRAAELELIQAQQDNDDFNRTADMGAAQAWKTYLDAQTFRAQAERDWEDLDLDYLEDQVDDALVEFRDQEYDLKDAQDEWDKYQDVDEGNYSRQVAKDDFEKAQEDYNEARRVLDEARQEIDGPRAVLEAALAAEAEALRDHEMWTDDGVDLDLQALLKARLAAADAAVLAAQDRLDDFILQAPFGGTVTDIYLEIGRFVGPESRAVQMADLSVFKIETSDLTELEVVKISEGQKVEITPDALPEITLSGTVETIGKSFQSQAGDVTYTATIKLDESHPLLRWGMTVELVFIAE